MSGHWDLTPPQPATLEYKGHWVPDPPKPDIKYWDLVWSGTKMLAHWFDPVTGADIHAPIHIAPDGSLRVSMPPTKDDIR